MAPQRILHVIGSMDRAGAETMIMNLYREIDRSQFQFDFLCFSAKRGDYDSEIEHLGGRIVRISTGNSLLRFFLLCKLLLRGNWQTVHSHTLWSSGFHLLAARLAKVPKRIAHSHSTNSAHGGSVAGRAYEQTMRWLLAWVPTHYVACGQAAAAYLFPSRSDVQLIPNAIDIDTFVSAQGTSVRDELGIDQETLVILQVGRLITVKNHRYSIKIARALRDAALDFQLLFVGTGPDQHVVKALVREYKLEQHVRFLGLRADIPQLMAAADVMLMPSLHEGFPVVLVESQAAGLPAVIATTISPEVDLALGLVNFVSLEAAPQTWAAQIQAAARSAKVPVESRVQTLEQAGFSARTGAQRLMGVYTAP